MKDLEHVRSEIEILTASILFCFIGARAGESIDNFTIACIIGSQAGLAIISLSLVFHQIPMQHKLCLNLIKYMENVSFLWTSTFIRQVVFR